jgi:hypothetical protein
MVLNKIKSTNISKYSFSDWYEGRITFGGERSFNSQKEMLSSRKKVLNVNWANLDKVHCDRIRAEQKKIFRTHVEIYFNKFKNRFDEMLNSSEDKNVFLKGTLNDFRLLFETTVITEILNLKYINKIYYKQEVFKIQSFHLNHIIRGLRHYDFIQSPKQNDSSFRNPPIELEAEMLFNAFQYIREKYGNNKKQFDLKNKISLREIALFYNYKGLSINRKNHNSIAKKYGHTSGQSLYQFYCNYRSKQNRIAPEDTFKQTKNKLDRLNRVKLLLIKDSSSTEEINREIKNLETKLLEHF